MDHKLLEITEKLFKEGIEKAEIEKKELLDNATKEAQQIVENANQQATEIIQKAYAESEEIHSRVNATLKLAGDNIMVKLKQDIKQLLKLKVVQQPIRESLSNADFNATILTTIAQNIYKDETQQIVIHLNQQDEQKIKEVIQNKLQQVLQQKPVFLQDDTITSGFKIGIEGSNYNVGFTDADFTALVSKFFNAEIISLFNAE
ncbi:MAG TPA: hypothetical protein VFM99_09355 [Chitinophagales bacterium]|nr:hypothetical protein [Chitinophagales bacterium]